MVKPLAVMMLGNHVPNPIATPKNAEKQIMPAMTRLGNILNTMPNGSLFGVARRAGGERLLRPGDAEAAEHVEGVLTFAVSGEIARQFRQGEAEQPYDQRADADHDPHAAPADQIAEEQREQRGDRPDASAADEMHDRQDAAADGLGRIFAGIGKGERLLAAETDAGDEAAGHQPAHRRRETHRGW